MTENYPHPTSSAVTAVMKGNRRSDTRPEIRLRSALHRRGYRFRKDRRITVPDASRKPRPDIVFTRQRVAVFVDGCFWHCCPEHGRTPKANTDYWGPKLARNRERDRHDTALLRQANWNVVRLWEHQPLDEMLEQVIRTLEPARRPHTD